MVHGSVRDNCARVLLVEEIAEYCNYKEEPLRDLPPPTPLFAKHR